MSRYATLLTCIDGRIQRPLADWAVRRLAVDYLDVVTEPGPEAVLSTSGAELLAPLLAKIRLSQRAHGSSLLVVASHDDCAANPRPRDAAGHDALRHAAQRLAAALPGTGVLGVHAAGCGARCWQPSLVTTAGPAVPGNTSTDAYTLRGTLAVERPKEGDSW